MMGSKEHYYDKLAPCIYPQFLSQEHIQLEFNFGAASDGADNLKRPCKSLEIDSWGLQRT